MYVGPCLNSRLDRSRYPLRRTHLNIKRRRCCVICLADMPHFVMPMFVYDCCCRSLAAVADRWCVHAHVCTHIERTVIVPPSRFNKDVWSVMQMRNVIRHRSSARAGRKPLTRSSKKLAGSIEARAAHARTYAVQGKGGYSLKRREWCPKTAGA